MGREQVEKLQCESERLLQGGGAVANDAAQDAAQDAQSYQHLVSVFNELPQLIGRCLDQSDVMEKVHSIVPRISNSCHRLTKLLSDTRNNIGRIGSMKGFDKSMSSTKLTESIKSMEPKLSTKQTKPTKQTKSTKQTEPTEQTVLAAPTTGQDASGQDFGADDMPNASSFDLLRSLNVLDVELEEYRLTTQDAMAGIAGLNEGKDKGKDEDGDDSYKPLDSIGGSSVLARIRPNHIPGHYKNLNYIIDEMYGKIEKTKEEKEEEEDIDDSETWDAGELGGIKADSYSDKLLDELNRLEEMMDE